MRHVRKQQKSLMPKILLIVVLVAALSISSVVTVMANTADITVYDGSETYRFSMIGQNPQDILSRAQTEGMAPVSDHRYLRLLPGERHAHRAALCARFCQGG